MAGDSDITKRELEEMTEALRALTDSTVSARRSKEELIDAEMKAKYGINNYTKVTQNASTAVAGVAKAVGAYASAMYQGQKGYTALNSSLDNLSSAATAAGVALMLLGGPITAVVGGLSLLVGAVFSAAKNITEFNDALYEGYASLAKSGAAASDGMSGLFEDSKKLGVGFKGIGQYAALVAESSSDLALFSGTVYKGRQQFANLGAATAQYRESLFRAGYTQEDINESLMSYIRIQSRAGLTQNKTAAELADGAHRYLLEQDKLTKLTGLTVKEQEAAREEVRSQERFAGKLQELRLQNRHDEAKALEDTYLILYKNNKTAAQGFADVSTGMLTTEAAIQSYNATQGESMRVSQQVSAGQLSAAQAAQRVAAAHGRTADRLGATFGQMGIYNKLHGDLYGDQKLAALAQHDITKIDREILEERKRQGMEGQPAVDPRINQQSGLMISQQRTMLAAQDAMNTVSKKTTGLLNSLAEGLGTAVTALADFVNWIFGKTRSDPVAEHAKAVEKLTESTQAFNTAQENFNKNQTDENKRALNAANLEKLRAERMAALTRTQIPGATPTPLPPPGAPLAVPPAAGKSQSQPAAPAVGKSQSQPAVPGPRVGGGLTVDHLSALGLNIKPGGSDVHAPGERISPRLIELAKKIQSAIPGFNYFSGFNDEYHKGTTSKHAEGMALDFTLATQPTAKQAKQIIDAIKGLGASKVLDEYNEPSSRSTAGHFHVEIPRYKDGGVVKARPGGTRILAAEAGVDEAVIPLRSGVVPVEIRGSGFNESINQDALAEMDRFKQEAMEKNTSQIAEITGAVINMVDEVRKQGDATRVLFESILRGDNDKVTHRLLENLVDQQRQTNDLSTKMLRAYQN